jgi:hypothetical protein
MQKVLLTLLLLSVLFTKAFGQYIDDFVSLSLYSRDSLPLFNSSAIRSQNIKKAYIVNISREVNRKGQWLKNDTCYAYDFNEQGKPVRQIRYHKPLRGNVVSEGDFWTDTISLPLKKVGRFDGYRKVVRVVTPLGSGKKVIEYVFADLNHKIDTAWIITTTFDKSGLVLETREQRTKFYLKNTECNPEEANHYRYRYDSMGRITYRQDVYNQKYITISYPAYGELTREYDSKTDSLIDERVTLIVNANPDNFLGTNVKTITTPNVQVTLSMKREGEADLISLITVIKNSSFPDVKYYLLTYE